MKFESCASAEDAGAEDAGTAARATESQDPTARNCGLVGS
jgi:hypothetical protein